MLDLTEYERFTLNLVGRTGRIFRQAESFTIFLGENIFSLDPDICKSLIDKKYLKEVQEDIEAWVYMAEAKMFEPNYIVEHNE